MIINIVFIVIAGVLGYKTYKNGHYAAAMINTFTVGYQFNSLLEKLIPIIL